MAYNTYQYYPYPQYQQQMSPLNQQINPNQMNQPITQPMQPQIQQPVQMQNGGFISVASEEEAFKWAVAPGNVMTFKVQGKPIVIEKSMGFSQLEEPKIDKYRLVKEDAVEAEPETATEYATKASVDALEAQISIFREELDNLKAKSQEAFKSKNTGRRKETTDEP